MKKNILSAISAIYIVLFANAQTAGRLVVSPERVYANHDMQLLYYPANKTAKEVSGVMYMYDTLYHWTVSDLKMTKSGDTAWKAAVHVPADAGFLAYKFKVGDSTDNNNDMGYFTLANAESGPKMAGAEAGYGLLRSPRYGRGVPNYFNNYSISDTATYMWLSNEILRHSGPVSAKALVVPYSIAAERYEGKAAFSKIEKASIYLRKQVNDGETTLLKLLYINQNLLHDSMVVDSVKKVLAVKYPNGHWARIEAYKNTGLAKDMESKYKALQLFIGNFPGKDEDAAINTFYNVDYNKVYKDLISIAIAKQDTDEIKKLIPTTPFMQLPLVYYKMIEIPYEDWKTMPAAQAYPYSAAIINRFIWLKQHQPAEYWFYSPNEWATFCDKTMSRYFVFHADILSETGHKKEALPWADMAQHQLAYQSTRLNELQAILLNNAGDKKAMLQLLRESVRLNQTSQAMLNLLKEDYVAGHKSDAGFDAYLNSLKDQNTVLLEKEAIRKSKKSLPAIDFSLTDAEGKTVKLSAEKGKVVVIDFWATWCAPCKAGMAGMKMAVDKYANDPNVVFYFLDTQERDPDYKKKGLAFLQQKNYSNFKVLYDNGDETYSEYAKLIKTSGIPFKVVVNPNGNLNFASVGYKGSPTGLADEIETMVELARSEK